MYPTGEFGDKYEIHETIITIYEINIYIISKSFLLSSLLLLLNNI